MHKNNLTWKNRYLKEFRGQNVIEHIERLGISHGTIIDVGCSKGEAFETMIESLGWDVNDPDNFFIGIDMHNDIKSDIYHKQLKKNVLCIDNLDNKADVVILMNVTRGGLLFPKGCSRLTRTQIVKKCLGFLKDDGILITNTYLPVQLKLRRTPQESPYFLRNKLLCTFLSPFDYQARALSFTKAQAQNACFCV